MEFKLLFNENLSREQYQMQFKDVWEKYLKESKSILIWIFATSMLGFFMLLGENKLGIFFLLYSLFLIFNYYNRYKHYKKSKKDFFRIVEFEISKHLENNDGTLWVFNENYFRYKDFQVDQKISWELFEGFKVINENLFLNLINSKGSGYIISKVELDEEKFNELIKFLEKKLKKKN